jgi:hypothetical protein
LWRRLRGKASRLGGEQAGGPEVREARCEFHRRVMVSLTSHWPSQL